MTRRDLTTTLAALALIAAPAAAGELKPSDLLGGYTIVSGEKFGKDIPQEEIKGTTVRIALDGIVITDKDKKEIYVATYKLEPGDEHCKIKLTSKLVPSGAENEVARGLIKKDGETVTLIYALPGGEAPTGFETHGQQLLFVMKNLNK